MVGSVHGAMDAVRLQLTRFLGDDNLPAIMQQYTWKSEATDP